MLRRPTSRTSLRAFAGALAAMAIVAPAASADTQRYASPAGSDFADCSPANPCSVTKAISSASAGDEVILAPGDYYVTKTLATPAQITIRGAGPQARPRLHFIGAGQNGLGIADNSLLRDVAIDQTAPTSGLYASPARIDRVIVTGLGGGALCTAHVLNSIVRDSIFVAKGTSGKAFCSSAIIGLKTTSSVRNVTAMATGTNGVAISADAVGTSASTVDLVNVIARGGQGGADLKTSTYAGGSATISATHTNYGTESAVNGGNITNGGGNQLFKTPLFVNAAGGDYRQAPGSPTIGAGVNDNLNGAYDFGGDPRAIGTTDIGADEFVMPPTLTTGAAGAVTGHAATLHGSVNAHGIPTSYRFEYGRTAAYDKATPTIAVGASLYAAAVATKVSGLTPATTYHYRIVASNGSGLVQGADHTFTTPGSTPPPPPPPPHAPFAGVGLVSTHLTTAGRFVTLKLSCPAGTIGSCSGKTKLSARKRRTGAKVRLGRVAFTIAPGRQAKVRLRVSRPGRRLLGHAARLHGRATSSARDTVGQAKTTVVAVTIRRRHA